MIFTTIADTALLLFSFYYREAAIYVCFGLRSQQLSLQFWLHVSCSTTFCTTASKPGCCYSICTASGLFGNFLGRRSNLNDAEYSQLRWHGHKRKHAEALMQFPSFHARRLDWKRKSKSSQSSLWRSGWKQETVKPLIPTSVSRWSWVQSRRSQIIIAWKWAKFSD